MSENTIQAAMEDGVWHVRLLGRVTFTMSRRFDAYIDEVLSTDPQDIVIDLRQSDYMDSTILGLLAKIARCFIARHHRKPTLLSTREDINTLLDSMGFEAAFELRGDVEHTPFYLEEIPPLEKSVPMPETLLEAHGELMELDDRNVDRFRDTVDALRESVEAKRQ